MGANGRLVPLAPAPPRPPPPQLPRVTFFSLPAEMRVEIYKLALEGVVVHILPTSTVDDRKLPHALTRTSRGVRNEVLPLIHALCPIRCAITDFCFDGLLTWMNRIPPNEENVLKKNQDLSIQFCFSNNQPQRSLESLRRWLHRRADKHRPQPRWQYGGGSPLPKVQADLRRRARRMTEPDKKAEMIAILAALNISVEDNVSRNSSRRQGS